MLTSEQEKDIYALRLSLCIAGLVDVKARLRQLRKPQSLGVLTFFQHAQLEVGEALASVRGVL